MTDFSKKIENVKSQIDDTVYFWGEQVDVDDLRDIIWTQEQQRFTGEVTNYSDFRED